MDSDMIYNIQIRDTTIELPIPIPSMFLEDELNMDETEYLDRIDKRDAITAKLVIILCNQIRDLQQQVRPKAEWIPITKDVHSRDKGSETIVAEYECTRCGRVETDDWIYCRCGAEMTNGNCRYPSKEEFADILKSLEETKDTNADV